MDAANLHKNNPMTGPGELVLQNGRQAGAHSGRQISIGQDGDRFVRHGFGGEVRLAIDLDNQARLARVEVGDVRTELVLAAELHAQLPAAKFARFSFSPLLSTPGTATLSLLTRLT